MNNHYQRYQNDVANTATQLVAQAVCVEKGLDYNQVLQTAQQAHINGILQQEQARQFQQVLTRYYGGNTFFGRLKEAFSAQPSPMMGMMSMGMPMGLPMAPVFPATPAPAPVAPPMASPVDPAQVASLLVKPAPAPETAQMQKDIEDLKQLVSALVQTQSNPV